jgi:nucleotide-binding universal stress UspA family protein
MPLRHIVAATNDTDEGRAAVRTATGLGQRLQSKVTVLAVAIQPLRENGLARLTKSLRETVARQLKTIQRPHPAVHFAVEFGLPGVEIGRFAESSDADLVVLGRKVHSTALEPGKGDTGDAVSRRSRVPCLFVRLGQTSFDHLLVALDGTERGLGVLHGAVEFARGTRARIRAVTVEPPPEADIRWVHTAGTERVSDAVARMRRSGPLNPEQWDFDDAHRPHPVLVRHGRVVEELLSEVAMASTDLLVFGCRRGGPSAGTEPLNIPRQLRQLAPCALLAIPL